MFFFFFGHDNGAAGAFKEAVKAENATYETIAARIGVSHGAIKKFVAGRPPSGDLLKKLISGFPPDRGLKILIAHLNDEIDRAGMDTDELHVIKKSPNTYVIDHLAQLVAKDSTRITEVVEMIGRWEKQGTEKTP